VTIVGQPLARLRVSASAPQASLSVKLCDVFPDGTSALVTRGTLDLRFRDGLHEQPQPLQPGKEYDVVIPLDACAYRFATGQTLRLSIAGADWPNTVAPPAPVALTVHGGELTLPVSTAEPHDPQFTAGTDHAAEDPTATDWTITDDVLRRTTTCSVRHGSDYETPHDGHAWEEYAGDVVVDRRTFAQQARADCTYRLTWPGIDVRVTSTMTVGLDESGLDVTVDVEAYDGEEQVARREWTERLPR
jgi:hypothetical protein